MKARKALTLMIGVLILASLACAQAGEVLTPAEATARAQESAAQPFTSGSTSVEGGVFEAGDSALLTDRSFLVNLYDEPGGKVTAGQERGAEVTVLEVSGEGEDIWYKIEAGTGQGWVPAENLKPLEEEAVTIEGPQPGDGAYLQGRSYLVNFYDTPGGKVVAGQERGAAVTILEAVQFEGDVWYKIDAPTGQGWVPAENITTEAP